MRPTSPSPPAEDDLGKISAVLDALKDELGFSSIDTDRDVAKVTLVGAGMRTYPGVAAKMFQVLAENGINIEMISTSSIKISCVIRKQQVQTAVKALHKAFKMDKEYGKPRGGLQLGSSRAAAPPEWDLSSSVTSFDGLLASMGVLEDRMRRSGVDAIVVDKLRKQFDPPKGPVAVDGVSFAIKEGEIFSLLGPNGAGKTTTISILSCLLKPDSGEADVGGFSVSRKPDEVKKLIGVVPQDIALYEDLSGRENLMFWGRMYGLNGTALTTRVDEVLDLIGLVDRQKDRVDKYSGGMKRRVNIGAALLHKPRILYLDEPTVGIDPQSRRAILDGVKDLNAGGMTVLYTTHYMEEAQELSDRIGIMDQGKMIAVGHPGRTGADGRRADPSGRRPRPRRAPPRRAVAGAARSDERLRAGGRAAVAPGRGREHPDAAAVRIGPGRRRPHHQDRPGRAEPGDGVPPSDRPGAQRLGRDRRPAVRPLAIAWKDVRHVYRSRSGLAMMLLAPLLLTVRPSARPSGPGTTSPSPR